MKNTIITITLIVLTTYLSYGQQSIIHTQHSTQRSPVNAASTLMESGGSLSFLGRRQWVGIEGSPTVYWGSGHVGFDNISATGGVNVRHESLGVERHTEASIFFAKSVRLSNRDYIGLSLNGGIAHHSGNFSSLDGGDASFREDIRDTGGLLGFGVLFYRPERYYVGVSMPRMMLSNLGHGGDRQYDFRNQYHAMGAMLFSLGEGFHVKPGFLLTYAENLGTHVDVSAMLYLQRMFGLGVNVRTYGDIAALTQIHYQGFGIGYSYQFNPKNDPLNRRISNSIHEIGISYRFGKKQNLL